MKLMKIARQIKIQRLQNKNRMTGQTFNPSGITSAEIAGRECEFISDMKEKGFDYRNKYFNTWNEYWNNAEGSNSWQWNAFTRAFIYTGESKNYNS